MSGSTESVPTTGPDRHWFVAIDDVDVGPIDITEIEARWRAGELQAQSLAWRPGMAEWQTVDTVPELAYLLEQIERQPETTVPATVQWVTGNATSLSDLVAAELEGNAAATAAAPVPAAPATQSIFGDTDAMGLPDLASLGFNSQQQSMDAGWGLPASSGPASFPPGPAPWNEPATDHSKRNLMMALIGGGFIVLTLGLVLAIVELVKGPPPPSTTAEVAALQPVPAEKQKKQRAEAPALEPVAVAPEPEPKPVVKPPRAKPKPTPRRTTPRKRPAPPPKKPPPQKPKPKPKPEKAAAKLSKADILNGIKRNAAKLMPCLKAARTKSEVPPGRIKFVLDWTIEANGSVSQPRLRGPTHVLSTSLPRCFSAQMRKWKFPASARSTNIKNFGLPIKLK